MWINILLVFLGAVLFLLHFYNNWIFSKWKKHSNKLASFVAGISVSYLFLYLFPELYEGVKFLNKSLFVYVLLGFMLLHIVEKQIRQSRSIEKLRLRLKEEHSIVFFVYYFILGIILVELINLNILKGLLFFFIILFHSMVSVASLKQIHQKLIAKKIFKIVLSISTLLGILFALFVKFPQSVYYILIGFVAGALLYIVVRDIIPKQSDSKLIYFIFGALLYMVLIMLTWL